MAKFLKMVWMCDNFTQLLWHACLHSFIHSFFYSLAQHWGLHSVIHSYKTFLFLYIFWCFFFAVSMCCNMLQLCCCYVIIIESSTELVAFVLYNHFRKFCEFQRVLGFCLAFSRTINLKEKLLTKCELLLLLLLFFQIAHSFLFGCSHLPSLLLLKLKTTKAFSKTLTLYIYVWGAREPKERHSVWELQLLF